MTICRAFDPTRPGPGPVVGRIRGDVLDLGRRARSRHMLRVPPAWCVDKRVLAEAARRGCRKVRFCETQESKIWEASIKTFRVKGFLLDRGHGKQVALPLEFWQTSPQSRVQQLSLF